MKKILVVDSHPIILRGIASMLPDKKYTMCEAATPEQALMMNKHVTGIDLVICGLSLPTTADGIEFIGNIHAIMPKVPIIVFTMHDELWNVKAIIDAEVDGIVMKGEKPAELLNAINSVLNGEKYLSPQFRKMRNEVMTSNSLFSRREIEIIREVSLGHKNRDIAEKYNMSEKAVEYHRSMILRKFGVKTIAEVIRMACEVGLLK